MFSRAAVMASATASMSSSTMPRVVRAGVPMRMPEVMVGGVVSNGMPFLFTVMPALPRVAWASLPVIFLLRRSTSMRWLSVPPETRSKPASLR